MKYNILIADDIEINRKLIKAILKNIDGVIVQEVDNGKQALEFMSVNDIDLLILDLMMPKMDGFQVLRELKTMENEIPIIVYSAIDEIDSLKLALDLGAYDFFSKPLTKEQISIVVPLKVKNALNVYNQRKQLIKTNKRLLKEVERVKYLNFHDSLTELYNRTFLDVEVERMEKDISRFLPLSILSIDLNDLKIVNDIFGHRAGDNLIKKAAQIISKPFRTVDIITRVGGDEFCVILPKVTRNIAIEKKEEILSLIDTYNLQNPVLPLSMAIGVATSEDERESIYSTYQLADDRMYKHKNLQSINGKNKVFELITKALKKRDYFAQGHGDRMVQGAEEIADFLNLPIKVKDSLTLLARIHDMGKIGIPDEILFKEGKLTEQEYNKIKEHSRIGYNIAKRTREFYHIADFILHHHERYDGNGYPSKLKGEDIPLECRIISVLDAYDSMTNERSYNKVLSNSQAFKELKKNSGTQFDPEIVAAFIEMKLSSQELKYNL
jgi:diguanylate cyclase (GGDEF)-like protein